MLYSERHEGGAQPLFAAASRLGYEGVVQKRVHRPPLQRGLEAWQKKRPPKRQVFNCRAKYPPASARLVPASTKARSLSHGEGVTGGNRAAPAKNAKPRETGVSSMSNLSMQLKIQADVGRTNICCTFRRIVACELDHRFEPKINICSCTAQHEGVRWLQW